MLPFIPPVHTIMSLGKWFNLSPCSEPSVKWIQQFLRPASAIRFGWCLQSTLRSLIGDILHNVHLQAIPGSRTWAGQRQRCCWGMNHLGVSRSSSSSLQKIQSWPSVRSLVARLLNLSYFFKYPIHPTQKFPFWCCWAWAAGGEPQAAAPSKALNSVLQPPPQTWAWQWQVPSGGRGGWLQSPLWPVDLDSWCLAVSVWPLVLPECTYAAAQSLLTSWQTERKYSN